MGLHQALMNASALLLGLAALLASATTMPLHASAGLGDPRQRTRTDLHLQPGMWCLPAVRS